MDSVAAGYRTLHGFPPPPRSLPAGHRAPAPYFTRPRGRRRRLSQLFFLELTMMQSTIHYGSPRRHDCGVSVRASLYGSEKNALAAMGKSPPASRPNWWSAMKGLSAGIQSFAEHYMVQGHLLNHHIGGGDTMDNLTPITKSANTKMLNFFEKDAKNAIAAGDNIDYSVEADYSGTAPTAAALAGANLSTADKLTLNGSGYMDYFCRWIKAETDVYSAAGALKSSSNTLWVSNEAS
ncbi:DNA/RNA non-specific endonuclease [Chromobacterium violaceum]|uniref:Uncharacterized protein n=2 Tax=Chromobacterium violaceum TaxID=536 RepID=A0A2R4K2M1_CHRVL|nr:DNA/RNA non-specific endonuclease [Chromobacterium violaceum]AVV48125.1 hypothetical protein [Chromobacterium violaceum]QRO35452.1 DNA/RNA non-specific endonuclease [Chromobacterium violaceum]QRQ19367.1 DNA/RNA non-specific endonuclease [Chromobacterium violaceum]